MSQVSEDLEKKFHNNQGQMLTVRGIGSNNSKSERDAYHPDVVLVFQPNAWWIDPLAGYGGETYITKS